MAFRCTPPTKDPVATLAYRPWELAIKPFQVAPQTWYVAGQTWVGCYLIDTGDGLILIDTAIAESAYMLVDSIYRLGYRPEQIKKILISHAHFDHCGAAAIMKKLTGAEMYMSKEDWEFMKACPKETIDIDKDSHPQYFEPDCFYSDEDVYKRQVLEFAMVQVPSVLPRIVELPVDPEGERRVILLEEVIERNMKDLFLNYNIVTAHPFRIMRNADFTLDEEEAEDLLEEIQKQLKKRQWGEVIRLEVEEKVDKRCLLYTS